MGTTTSGIVLGTVFDDQATRLITDTTATAPYTSYFRPEGDGSTTTSGDEIDDDYGGATPTTGVGGIDGTWILQITDNVNSGTPPPNQSVRSLALTFTSGQVAGTQTRSRRPSSAGSLTGTYPTAAPATPNGIGPGLVLASDNTLGAYSQFQGRIYAAFVDHIRDHRQPRQQHRHLPRGLRRRRLDLDRPDPERSDDRFQQFGFDTVLVNDDNAATDGFSGSVAGLSGRPQFQPSIAVDQTTGTLVMSWFDTRNDAAAARVATYVTYSIDGGNTFSPQIYANYSQTATDAITGDPVILGPVPDNESPGNPNTEGTFGFGTHQGLAVYGGHVYLAWASNTVVENVTAADRLQRRARRQGPAQHQCRHGGHPRRAPDHREHRGAGRRPGRHRQWHPDQRRHADRQRLRRHLRPAGRSRDLHPQPGPGLLPRHDGEQCHRRPGPGHLGSAAQSWSVRRDRVPGQLRAPQRRRHVQLRDQPDPTRATATATVTAARSPRSRSRPAAPATSHGHDLGRLGRLAVTGITITPGFGYTSTPTVTMAPTTGISDRIRTSITTIVPAGAPLPPFDSTDGPIPLQPYNTSTNTPGVIDSTIQINNASSRQPGRQQSHGHGEHRLDQRRRPDPHPDRAGRTRRSSCSTGRRPRGFGPTSPELHRHDLRRLGVPVDYWPRPRRRRTPARSSPPSRSRRWQGESINGTWTLEIENSGKGSTTTYESWSLSITPGTVTTTSNIGNLMDQNADGVTGETTLNAAGTDDVYSIPMPANGHAVRGPLQPDHASADRLRTARGPAPRRWTPAAT